MGNYAIVNDPTLKGFHTLASHRQPCRSDILDGLFRVFEDAFACRKRHLFVRFDLHLPQYHGFANPEEPFNRFVDSYVKNRRREGHDPRVLWCREQAPGARSPHLHLFCLFSARKTLMYKVHLDEACRLWGLALGIPDASGLIDFCTKDRDGNPQRNGILLDLGDTGFERNLRDCVRWGSYLAKLDQKGNAPVGAREWGCSQAHGRRIHPYRSLAELCGMATSLNPTAF